MTQTTLRGRLAASACALLALAVTAPYSLATESPDEPELAGKKIVIEKVEGLEGIDGLKAFFSSENRFVISDDDGTQTMVKVEKDEFGDRYYVKEDGEWIEKSKSDLDPLILNMVEKVETPTFRFKTDGSEMKFESIEDLKARFPDAKILNFTSKDFPEGEFDFDTENFFSGTDGSSRLVLRKKFEFDADGTDIGTAKFLLQQAERSLDRAETEGADTGKLEKAKKDLERALQSLEALQEE